MNWFGVYVAVQILMTPNGPEVKNVVLDIVPIEECKKKVELMRSSMLRETMTEDGKLILQEERQCLLIEAWDLEKAIEKIKK